jgi:hypothetical protein
VWNVIAEALDTLMAQAGVQGQKVVRLGRVVVRQDFEGARR